MRNEKENLIADKQNHLFDIDFEKSMLPLSRRRRYRRIILIILLGLLTSFTFFTETNAQARRMHAEHRRAVRIAHLPPHYTNIVVGPRRYFYNGGIFYRRTRAGYAIVTAPIGARIAALPVGFVRLRIGRADYFYFNGVYYNYIPEDRVYVVVEKPAGAEDVSNLKLDLVKMYDGSTLQGVFQSATDSTITFMVNNEDQVIPINSIISITFAPSIQDSTQ
jgi:Family of unknown function (DUF6515)